MDPRHITVDVIGNMRNLYIRGQAKGEKLSFSNFKTDPALKGTPGRLTFTVSAPATYGSTLIVANCTFYSLMWFVNFANAEELMTVVKRVTAAVTVENEGRIANTKIIGGNGGQLDMNLFNAQKGEILQYLMQPANI